MRILSLLCLISVLCFPAFAITFGKPLSLFYFTSVITVSLFFILYRKHSLRTVKKLMVTAPSKYFFHFFLWIICGGFLLVLLGKYSLSHYIYYMVTLLFITLINMYILPSLIVPKFISIKLFIKFLICVYMFICITGIIQFLGNVYNISFINEIFSFVDNIRFLKNEYFKFYSARLAGVFEEPGWCASFLVLNMPIVYNVCLSKYKIFNHYILNYTVKKTTIPLFWICLILTKSPIWLIFGCLYTLIHCSQKILGFMRKNIIIVIISLFLLFIPVLFLIKNITIDISESYINRIVVFFTTISDWQTFVQAENSLATRLLSYYYTLKVFVSNFLLGVGLGNTKFHTFKYIVANPLDYTLEFQLHFAKAKSGDGIPLNGGLLYDILADTGIIGFVLFYRFLIKNVLICKKFLCVNLYNYQPIIQGLFEYSILLICISIYDISYATIYIWLLLGLIPVFINKKPVKI